MFVLAATKAFVPVLGDRLGRTNILLAAVTKQLLESALGAAWAKRRSKTPLEAN
jgi:hypothetical protein